MGKVDILGMCIIILRYYKIADFFAQVSMSKSRKSSRFLD